MDPKEAKKRGFSPYASPERIKRDEKGQRTAKTSAVNVAPGGKAVQSKKKYKFAPVDTLSKGGSSEPPVLRSISLSQIRNSKKKEAPIENSESELKPAFIPKITNKTPNNRAHLVHSKLEPVNGPSEEVIWHYSPLKNSKADHSDKDRCYRSPSEDSIIEQAVKESSTPIVPNKFKTVLNFSHMSSAFEPRPESAPAAAKRNSLRQNSMPKSLSAQPPSRASARDIDEIINDIEDGFEAQPAFRHKDIPSSPTKMVSQRLQSKRANSQYAPAVSIDSQPIAAGESNNDMNNDNDSNNDSDEDEDDSLICILTQKFGCQENKDQPKSDITGHSSDTGSDDTCDDSLIDYLQSRPSQHTTAPGHGQVLGPTEDEITSVESKFSQHMTMKDTYSGNSDLIKKYIEKAQIAVLREGMKRLVILQVSENNIKNKGKQKILKCIDYNGEISNIITRAPWVYLDFCEGDVIHTISGSNFANKKLFSNDRDPTTGRINDNLLILNPDILLSATTVGGAIECRRRALLCGQISGPGEPSLAALIGNIVHELVQSCLKYKLDHAHLTKDHMISTLDTILDNYVVDIIMCQSTKALVLKQITDEHIPHIKEFLDTFVKNNRVMPLRGFNGTKIKQLSISNIIDIEENIWSSMYGLKGFIDATVETKLSDNSHYISPLELKTGKFKSITHEAQGSIYNLLLNDRYELPVSSFLLFYTKTNDFTKHDTKIESLLSLLALRNEISVYLKHELTSITDKGWHGTKLPPVLRGSICDKCYSKNECMVLNNLCEDGTAEESGLKVGEYDAITGHLKHKQTLYKEFYLKYEDLIVKEESSLKGINNEIFLFNGKTRESLSGKCLSNLVIAASDDDGTSKLIKYTFTRKGSDSDLPSFTNSQLSKNDMVIVSDESGHFALCTGRVASISSTDITVSTSRRLQSNNIHAAGFEKKNKQMLETVLIPSKRKAVDQQHTGITYRIDKNEVQQGLALARFNLLNLFLPPIPDDAMTVDPNTGLETKLKKSWGGDAKTRELVVDGRAPRFVPSSQPPHVPCKRDMNSQFNEDQWNAYEKIMRMEDYALVLGMPGTGKTTLIVEVVKTLAANGKSVLLASYTHSAIDNILTKLKNCEIDIIRLGHQHRIHQEVRKFVPDFTKADTYQEFSEMMQKPSVVATTCLNINDVLLSLRREDFDYVILDEASQLSLPICLGPLKFASKFVLVGDHYQLPPLVRNEAARAGGLDVSLFQLLCERHPESVVELTHQYRMCQDVMTLSNFLIYSGKLKCGNEWVRDQKLTIPDISSLERLKAKNYRDRSWLENVMDCEKKVLFLDHGRCPSFQEVGEKDNIKNPNEAELVWQCVTAMVRCGVPQKDIGVMTLYRAQLRLLRKTFESEEYADLEILTADQFQGRDKQCIIISMVRSNEELNGGSLLRELRRVNVAMTRAKCKLIIIGSKATIGSVDTLRGFMNLLEARGWLYSLPHDCLDHYEIPRPPASQKTRDPNPYTKVTSIRADARFAADKPILRDTLNGIQPRGDQRTC